MIDRILFKRINKKSKSALQCVWDESLDQNLKLKLIGQIIGGTSHMDTLNYFYGVMILELVLQHNDTSKTSNYCMSGERGC